MSEEKSDPQWKPASMEADKPVKITLNSAKSIAEGESKYGTWTLWPISVEDQPVFEKEGNKEIKNYSGDAVMFPSKKLNEQFNEITGGTKEGCEVEITLTPVKGKKGFYTSYKAKMVSEGTISSDSVGFSHSKYMEDFKKFADNKVLDETEDTFMEFGTREPYNHDKEFLKDLWKTYKTTHGIA